MDTILAVEAAFDPRIGETHGLRRIDGHIIWTEAIPRLLTPEVALSRSSGAGRVLTTYVPNDERLEVVPLDK